MWAIVRTDPFISAYPSIRNRNCTSGTNPLHSHGERDRHKSGRDHSGHQLWADNVPTGRRLRNAVGCLDQSALLQ